MTGTVLIVRTIAIILVLFFIFAVMRAMLRFAKKQHLLRRQKIAMEANRATLSHDSNRKTGRLNSRFFGGVEKENDDLRPNPPDTTLPMVVMPRVGRKFSGEDLDFLIKKFGFQYSPNRTYETIADNGNYIFCTMLNILEPGTFPAPHELTGRDAGGMKYEFDGMLFILQLPISDDPIKDWETFYALMSDIANACGGRLCDYTRRPLGDHDISLYHAAVKEFEQKLLKWQNEK